MDQLSAAVLRQAGNEPGCNHGIYKRFVNPNDPSPCTECYLPLRTYAADDVIGEAYDSTSQREEILPCSESGFWWFRDESTSH